MKKISFFLYLSISSVVSIGQTVLLEEDFSNGIPSDWIVQDIDQLTPNTLVSAVTEAWVGFTTASDTCAISTSFYDVNSSQISQSEDYLILPKQDLLAFGHLLSWESKSFDANYPENYYVLLSTTDSMPDSFTDTLKIVNGEAPYWHSHSVNLFTSGFANQSVYIAFRNASENAFLLGVDNVKLTTNDPAKVSKNYALDGITFYPNPVEDVLNFNEDIIFDYKIISITGKEQFSGVVTEKHIDLSSLSRGTYFLVLNSEKGSITKKIIKK